MNIANIITLLRYPLLIIVVYLLYQDNPTWLWIAFVLNIILLMMDTIDGVVARRYNMTTMLGSALDIATDRAVEIVLWIVYTDLGLISVVIPIIVVIRGMLTDSIRSVAMQHGYTAHKMMQTEWGRFIVASSAMRTTYSVTKIAAFLLLNMGLALQAGGSGSAETVLTVGGVLAWLAAFICIIRGLPVIVEAPRFFAGLEDNGV